MTASESSSARAHRGGDEGGLSGGDALSSKPRRSVKAVALELWHQKPGARALRPPAAPVAGEKEIVNGLDKREVIIGTVLGVIDIGLAILAFFTLHGSHIAKDRQAAPTYLVAGLIAAAIMLGGVIFRRRALLGFGSFFVGMELLTTGLLLEAVVFLFFGGWLIFRVMKKTKRDQAAGRFTGTVDTGGRRRGRATAAARTPAPKPSKRYTPPRRRASAPRR